jgi:RNA polymerase sigma-70 factor (ECF subfamily)
MEASQAQLLTHLGAANSSFGETNWWVIAKAGQPETTGADAARESLCEKYWRPIFVYLRRLGYGLEDAQDLTQSFFACVLQKNYLRSAAREKGRFRSFLLVMLKRFLVDQRDRTHREKRGGGKEVISLDSGDTTFRSRIEPTDQLTPEKAFERNRANSLLSQALDRLAAEMAATAKNNDFIELKPLVMCESQESYAAVAQRLHWTESHVKVSVHRLRRRLGDLLRSEIIKTASTPDDVEVEIRNLFAAFQ